MRTSSLILLIFCSLAIFGQDDPLHWKNRKPFEGYWQQDVSYEIRATLDDEKNVVDGVLELTYTNNSPNELDRLYFHLYQNAFEPGSYRNQFENRRVSDSLYQHTEISQLLLEGGSAEYEVDNTILLVTLADNQLIAPGEEVKISVDFKTYFGSQGGRMKMYDQFGFKHFNVVHWYPRISVYDRKFGWTTDQHLGHEFYGDFGSFNVSITLPDHYILDGTGKLLNRSEVLPDELMKKLDISNFKDKKWGEIPSIIIAESKETKTWEFRAENVHDFAWTADPTYRIGHAVATLGNGRKIDCYSLAQEQHAAGWQNAASYTAQIIELYSRDFGEYTYPKMIVVDARDGMEYPMLTLDGGRDPGYRDLLAHEVGHNWFFGMVGNNETYRAALDEGFTQFLTCWAMEHMEGDTISWAQRQYGLKLGKQVLTDTRTKQVYNGYYRSAIKFDEDPSLNTHSDHFTTRGGYGQVYYKTATMLYNLQYVLGDSLFLESMQFYFNEWKFCHPYFDDFRTSIIQHSGTDLNWFFDQWLESDGKIDYRIQSFKKKNGGYELKIQRKGEMQMPLAIQLEDRNSKTYDYWVPNTAFVKQTEATVFNKWLGWGDNAPTYTMQIDSLEDIRRITIDASNRLADVYQLDNKLPFPVDLKFDNLSYTAASHAYSVEWRPNIWFNGFDGIKIGFQAKGDYFHTHHLAYAAIWYNTGLGQQTANLEIPALENDWYRFNYRFSYATPMRAVAKNLSLSANSGFVDGLLRNKFGWQIKLPNKKTTISQNFESLYLPGKASLNYPIYSFLWNANQWNNFSNIILKHKYRYKRRSEGRLVSILRSPVGVIDYQYGFFSLESINENRTQKLNLRTRIFGQVGFGNNWAPESQLMMASANPESISSNPWIRSAGFIPSSAGDINGQTGWFQSGGGLNLRGYNGYVLPELNSDSLLRFAHYGQTGIALNTELEFDDMVRLLPAFKRWVELKTYLFGDIGMININRDTEKIEFSSLRADAGLGLALNIKQWGDLTDLKPTTLRFDFPLFLNRPPSGQDYISFRWLIAIDRAF